MTKKEINIQEEINRINGIIKNARLIREGLYLEDDDYPDNDSFDLGQEEMPEEPEQSEDPAKSLDSDFVSKIRAITLDGMKQLNNTPEDPRFQALLKIFNICNKAADDKNEQDPKQQAM